MSTGDSRPDEIIKLLTELIDLVKKNQPKVENHTHHHYPSNPHNWYYPTTNSPWLTGGTNVSTGGYFQPGSTTTWSTNDGETKDGETT